MPRVKHFAAQPGEANNGSSSDDGEAYAAAAAAARLAVKCKRKTQQREAKKLKACAAASGPQDAITIHPAGQAHLSQRTNSEEYIALKDKPEELLLDALAALRRQQKLSAVEPWKRRK
eukprot:gene2665-2965_t